MATAVHFKCDREPLGWRGLSTVPGERGVYTSRCWVLRGAQSLVGGWIYLHENKNQPSGFGGRILRVDPCHRVEAEIAEGVVFTFEATRECVGQSWRGRDDVNAWCSGIIEGFLPHEVVDA